MSMNPREINALKRLRRSVLNAIGRYNPNPVTDKMVADDLADDDVVIGNEQLRQVFQYLADLDLIELDTTRYGTEVVWAVRIKADGVDFLCGIGGEYKGIA